MFVIGSFTPRGKCLVAEGFATAATLHENTGYCVVTAFNAKNLKPVTIAIRQRFKDIDLTIAADNDRFTEGNPGVTCANEAAIAACASVIISQFYDDESGTDFNDLARLRGGLR